MERICPVCGKRVKANESQVNIPVGTVDGLTVFQTLHLDCFMELTEKEVKEMFPYYYKLVKESS